MLVIRQHNMSCGILASLSVPTTSSTKSASCSSTSCQHFWLTFFLDCRELNQCEFMFLMLHTQWACYGLKFIRDLFVPLRLSICPSVHMYILPSVYPPMHLSIHLSGCLSIHPSNYVSMYMHNTYQRKWFMTNCSCSPHGGWMHLKGLEYTLFNTIVSSWSSYFWGSQKSI